MIAPSSKEVNKTMDVIEYSFSDPDYAVPYSITIKGHDTRNMLGYGYYQGIFAAENWELSQNGWTVKATFPVSDTYCNAYAIDDSSQPISTNVCSLIADRKWESLVVLMQEISEQPDGNRIASFDPQTGHFIVSASISREEAFAEAYNLTKGTALENVF